MDTMVATAEVTASDILIYVGISLVVFGLLDMYAKKKMGSHSYGYQDLKPHRILMYFIVCGYSAVILLLCLRGLSVKSTTETFLGVPYLVCWFYYLTYVIRRVKAEKK